MTRAARPRRTTASSATPSIAAEVATALAWLERRGTRKNRDSLARYGITAPKAFGVSMTTMQALAKRLGRNHALAHALWDTGWYEARTLVAFVADPAQTTPAEMDAWCRDFDNWAICDSLCFYLFDRTPHAWAMVGRWARRRPEFEKRAGFALLAALALHDKAAPESRFRTSFALIERAATDERNFVKKGVSWALRAIGHRNLALHAAAVRPGDDGWRDPTTPRRDGWGRTRSATCSGRRSRAGSTRGPAAPGERSQVEWRRRRRRASDASQEPEVRHARARSAGLGSSSAAPSPSPGCSPSRSVPSPPRTSPSLLEQFAKRSREAEAKGLAEPFRGITAAGTAEPNLYPVRSTGVTTEPVRTAAVAFLASLTDEQRRRTVVRRRRRRVAQVDESAFLPASGRELRGVVRRAARRGGRTAARVVERPGPDAHAGHHEAESNPGRAERQRLRAVPASGSTTSR